MKSILIIGASNAGKSTTMREVCRRLNPEKVYWLNIDKGNLEHSKINESNVDAIFNNTFIIKVQGKFILVIAGSSTEQKIKITGLIDICIQIKINISFALVSMRSFEKTNGFDTPTELGELSDILLMEKIYKIDADEYEKNSEWNNRIDRIVAILKNNI